MPRSLIALGAIGYDAGRGFPDFSSPLLQARAGVLVHERFVAGREVSNARHLHARAKAVRCSHINCQMLL